MSRCPAQFAAPIVAGAVTAALWAGMARAQEAATMPPDLRATIGEQDQRRRPAAPPRRRTADPTRPGQIPTFGVPSGAGKTGFVSRKRKPARPRPPSPLTPEEPVGIVPRPATPLVISPLQAAEQRPQIPPSAATATAPAPPAGSPAPRKPARAKGTAARDANGEAITYDPIERNGRNGQDPFEQVGVRGGAFLFKPAIEVTSGYDTNPSRSTGGKGSSLAKVAPELNVQSEWQRHELTASLRGSYSWYPSASTENRPDVNAVIKGRIDVTDRTKIKIEGRYTLSTDNPGSPDLPADIAKLPVFQSYGTTLGVSHRFNRLELAVNGTVDRTEYQASKLLDGSTSSNKDRNYNQYGAQFRATYDFLPGLRPFAEFDVDTRVHDLRFDRFGEQRDSDGFTGKVGTKFEITRLLTGEIATGYTLRTYRDAGLPDLKGFLLDASLAWAATGLTTVRLNGTTTVDETTLPGVSGVLRRDIALQVDHAFRRWLIGSLRFGYGHDDYQGSPRADQRYLASAAIIYKLSRSMQIKGEFRQEWLRSNEPGNDYDASIALIGLRWQP